MRAIAKRPLRTTRVTLPSGQWEPPFYPPPKIYQKEEMGKAHPLWQFFKVPPRSMLPVNSGTKKPPSFGSLWSLRDMRLANEGE